MALDGGQELQIKHLRSAAQKTITPEASETLSSQINDLSVLELCLLVAIKHLSQIYQGEPFDFETVFLEYLKFQQSKMPFLPDERSFVSKSWETLVEF